jgi:hypothetical protein
MTVQQRDFVNCLIFFLENKNQFIMFFILLIPQIKNTNHQYVNEIADSRKKNSQESERNCKKEREGESNSVSFPIIKNFKTKNDTTKNVK